jgi:protein-S-isoprenylcysteine O-methyltransferase Ste14
MRENRDTAGVIAPPPLLAAGALAIGLILDWLLPAYLLDALLSLSQRIVIGIVLMAAGGALGLAAVRVFRRAGTHVEPWKPSSTLVTVEVFQWLRNPMYVGLICLVAGFAIMIASDWTLVMTIVLALVLHVGVVRREERYLEARFGDTYRGYKARVPRYGWPPVSTK